MRYRETSEITLSEDSVNPPSSIRFSEKDSVTDLALLVDGGGDSKTYAIGTHVIDLSQITKGKFFYVKPYTNNVSIILNGGSPMLLLANKPSRMFVEFTSFSIVTTLSTRITVAVAGE